MNSAKKHTSLSDEEISQTKQTLIKLSHRLRMQIPSELIDVSRHRLAAEQEDESGFETLSSLRLRLQSYLCLVTQSGLYAGRPWLRLHD